MNESEKLFFEMIDCKMERIDTKLDKLILQNEKILNKSLGECENPLFHILKEQYIKMQEFEKFHNDLKEHQFFKQFRHEEGYLFDNKKINEYLGSEVYKSLEEFPVVEALNAVAQKAISEGHLSEDDPILKVLKKKA